VRRFVPLLILAALTSVDNADADSQSFMLSTGHNESALTHDFNRGTVFIGQAIRGGMLYRGTIDSRGLGSIALGRIFESSDIDVRTTRYPVVTLFGRPGEGSGIAIDLHQDWFWRGNPTATPAKFVTMFQTQGGLVFQDGHAPKVRVTHRLVTSQRRLPARTQGVEWIWEFRDDYPAVYSPTASRGAMQPLSRRRMRAENWIFFSRELGAGVVRVNVGATYKTVRRDNTQGTTPIEQAMIDSGDGYRRVPVLLFRLGYEITRW
jgi:hypothetical protein